MAFHEFIFPRFTHSLRIWLFMLCMALGHSALASGCEDLEYTIKGIILDTLGNGVDGALVLAFFDDDIANFPPDESQYAKDGKLNIKARFLTDKGITKEILMNDKGEMVAVKDCSRIPKEVELIIYKQGYSVIRRSIKELGKDQRMIDIGTINLLKYNFNEAKGK